MQGTTELVLRLYGGQERYCTRSLLPRRNNQYAGLRVPARGRGGVQVLERLGPESAQRRNPTRSLLFRRSNQYAGLRVPARGRGGVQVLERLGPESAENLYSPAPPGQCRGLQNLCCGYMAGRNPTVHVRYFLGETISTRACGCRPGDAGEYRFWNAWGLKVPKTCTPPRPPGPCRGLQNLCCLCMAGRNPTRSLLFRRNNQYAGLRVPARGRGGVQVLERLGPESAENLYSPAPPGQCRGLQNLCCGYMAGRNATVHVRYFLGETINKRACGCAAARGSTGFGTLGA